MFASPNLPSKASRELSTQIRELSTQLSKTYLDEDSHLRRLTAYKNSVTVDDYLAVVQQNTLARIKLYRELFGYDVSEFDPHGKPEPPAKDDYLIIELVEPKRSVRLMLSNLPQRYYGLLQGLLQEHTDSR